MAIAAGLKDQLKKKLKKIHNNNTFLTQQTKN
jgi:hypothetical protein